MGGVAWLPRPTLKMTPYINLSTTIDIYAPIGIGSSIVTLLETWRTRFPREFASDDGWIFICWSDGKRLYFHEKPMNSPGSSRIQFSETKSAEVVSDRDIVRRFDMPIEFLRDRRGIGKYSLYNIRFAVSPSCPIVDHRSVAPFHNGYAGITKRGIFTRFLEHERDAAQHKGHLLHSAWSSLKATGAMFYPVVQFCAHDRTLEGIYDAEERVVAARTLSPMGLNMIPGGMAGIKMLHQMGAKLPKGIPSSMERDAALECLGKIRGSVSTHYRSGHFRRLDGREVWISPCWVNLPKVEVDV